MSHRAKRSQTAGSGEARAGLAPATHAAAGRADAESPLALERIVFFSDAVFAIAITLLVLELKLPGLGHDATERELLAALLALIPRAAGFLVSFFLIGQTWVEHHRLWGFVARHDTGLIWRNLLMLLFVAVVPFTTSLFSEHHTSSVALAVYAGAFALMGLAKVGLWRHAVARGLLHPGFDPVALAQVGARTWAAPLGAVIVLLLAIARVPFAWLAFLAIPALAQLLHRAARR
jgi:uncharacterized membrane protein